MPLLDWVGQDNWGYNGVLSIATDPVDPNRVYAAVGMYTNSWDPNNGAILRSTDRGATWQTFKLPFKNGGNMPGRGMGERLAVDPHNNRNVYFAAEGGNGLWRSTDYGATFAKVTAFPNAGNYVQDPNDTNGYLSQNQGLTWVTFDDVTRDVYVGVADKANPVYRSADGGDHLGPDPRPADRIPGPQGRGDRRLPLHRHQRHRRPVRGRRPARCSGSTPRPGCGPTSAPRPRPTRPTTATPG